MRTSELRIVLDYLYRHEYSDEILDFQGLVYDAIVSHLERDPVLASHRTNAEIKSLWNTYIKEHNKDISAQIVPLFDIIDKPNMKVRWIGSECSHVENRKRHHYKPRPQLYRLIDGLTPREYEALAYILCKLMGAENVQLTDEGNEGGVDFIAQIRFSESAHFIFGTKGPVRIIGQSKKYSTSVQKSAVKEFITTLNDVHNLSYRVGEILPTWFRTNSGPIIGWHISHSGHQSGALDYAKNYGILTSSSKELVDLMCRLKVPGQAQGLSKADYYKGKISELV